MAQFEELNFRKMHRARHCKIGYTFLRNVPFPVRVTFWILFCGESSAFSQINPSNAELNPICYLLALLAHHFLHVSRIRVKSLTLRLLMSYIYIYIYIYMEYLFLMFLDQTQRRSTVGRTPLDE